MNKYLAESLKFLQGLELEQVEYLIIGGVAVNIHGFQRATGDLDIWFNPTEDNFQKLLKAFVGLGYDTSDFERTTKPINDIVVRLPLESFYIELLPFLDGKGDFKTIQQRAESITVEGFKIPVISYDDLITCKVNVHRAKDLEDIAQLEKRKQQQIQSNKIDKNKGQGIGF
jgi:predicted nucleotidyltransferase